MTDFLKTADLTQNVFLKLIENLPLDAQVSTGYIWLEAADGWTLDRWNWEIGIETEIRWYRARHEPVEKSAKDCLAKSTAGRLFAMEGELRWRTIPALGEACWRTVFLGNVDWAGPTLENHSQALNNLRSHQKSFYLWGQQTQETPDEWIELRIPHRFQYPIAGNPHRVKILTEQWDDATGEPHFVRLCTLKPAEETTSCQ